MGRRNAVRPPIHSCVVPRKVVPSVLAEHAPGWAEVVVDDVENHSEAELVCAIDERAKVVRRAVQSGWRVRKHAVVTPAEPAGKLRDRHDFDGGDPGLRQIRKVLHRGAPGPLAGEGADVTLVQHLPFQRDAAPRCVAPRVAPAIDDR